MKRLPFALLGVLLLGAPVGAQTILIDHRAVACAAAERFPRIDARFAPIDGLAKARVLFQGDNRAEWYSVAMKAESDSFVGVLPKPKKSLKAFRYYVEVTSKTLETSRTPEFSTAIVSSSSECKGGLMAGSVAAASVVVQGPTGAAVLPGGFASAGVVAGAAAGAAAAGVAVAGGGGLSGGALVGVIAGVGGAAAAGIVVAGKGGEDHGPTGGGPSPTPTPAPTAYSGAFSGVRVTDNIFPGGCQTWTQDISGTLAITLQATQGATVTGTAATTGAITMLSTSGPCGPLMPPSSIGWNLPLSGSPAAMTFGAQNGSGGITESLEFSGSLSGGVITGTLTFTHKSDLGRFGQAVLPVTLR